MPHGVAHYWHEGGTAAVPDDGRQMEEITMATRTKRLTSHSRHTHAYRYHHARLARWLRQLSRARLAAL